VKGRIQCSQATAEALTIAGKEHWFRPREDAVTAKGKGVLKTYWVIPNAKAGSQSASTDNSGRSEFEEFEAPQEIHARDLLKREREIDWLTELLSECVRNIVGKHDLVKAQLKGSLPHDDKMAGHIPLDGVTDLIHFPEVACKLSDVEEKAKAVKVPEKIAGLLRQFVSIVSLHACYTFLIHGSLIN